MILQTDVPMSFNLVQVIGLIVTSGVLQTALSHLLSINKRKLEDKEKETTIQEQVEGVYGSLIDSLKEEISRLRKRVEYLEKIEAEKWSIQTELQVAREENVKHVRELQSLRSELEVTKLDLQTKKEEYRKLHTQYVELTIKYTTVIEEKNGKA